MNAVTTQKSHFELDALLAAFGKAGRRLAEMGASEGAAGNISVCLRRRVDVSARFPRTRELALPHPVPDLAGSMFIVTGSGRRLREIMDDPTAHLACIIVNEGGQTGQLHTAEDCPFERVTSEFNSHLAVHHDRMRGENIGFQAIIHAQPVYLTYLSHIPRYWDETHLNRHLLRWQPEAIINLPEGIGMVPFHVPGSAELMSASVASLHEHRIAIWTKHGVMVRSDDSLDHAVDLLEYAETAAKYEYLDLTAHEIGEGLTAEEIRAICREFHVKQDIF